MTRYNLNYLLKRYYHMRRWNIGLLLFLIPIPMFKSYLCWIYYLSFLNGFIPLVNVCLVWVFIIFGRYRNDCSLLCNVMHCLAYLIYSWYYYLYTWLICLVGFYNHKVTVWHPFIFSYILVSFNNLLLVVHFLIYILGWSFPVVANQVIILCDMLLYFNLELVLYINLY